MKIILKDIFLHFFFVLLLLVNKSTPVLNDLPTIILIYRIMLNIKKKLFFPARFFSTLFLLLLNIFLNVQTNNLKFFTRALPELNWKIVRHWQKNRFSVLHIYESIFCDIFVESWSGVVLNRMFRLLGIVWGKVGNLIAFCWVAGWRNDKNFKNVDGGQFKLNNSLLGRRFPIELD